MGIACDSPMTIQKIAEIVYQREGAASGRAPEETAGRELLEEKSAPQNWHPAAPGTMLWPHSGHSAVTRPDMDICPIGRGLATRRLRNATKLYVIFWGLEPCLPAVASCQRPKHA